MTVPYLPPPFYQEQRLPSQEFLQALGFVISQERAEFTNRPRHQDPGGPTKFGVTQRTLNRYRRINSDTSLPRNVSQLTEDQARIVYYNEFWRQAVQETPSGPLRLAFFDTAVHSGPAVARRLLRASRGDAQRLINLREAFLRSRPHARYNPGWFRRLAALRRATAPDPLQLLLNLGDSINDATGR